MQWLFYLDFKKQCVILSKPMQNIDSWVVNFRKVPCVHNQINNFFSVKKNESIWIFAIWIPHR